MTWLALGDSNSAFFHKAVLVRRHRSRTSYIKTDDDLYIDSKLEIQDVFTNFYANLWSSLGTVHADGILRLSLPSISPEAASSLTLPFSLLEARHALSGLSRGKAPGSDGLHASFYRRFWLLTAPELL